VPRLGADGSFLLRPWELDDLDLVRDASRDSYVTSSALGSMAQQSGDRALQVTSNSRHERVFEPRVV
jgi:hypothetical protein